MIYWLYENHLRRKITVLPAHICFMLTAKDLADAPEKPALIISWCNEVSEYISGRNPGSDAGIQGVTFHISSFVPEELDRYLPEVRKIKDSAHLILHVGEREEEYGTGRDVVVAVGKSGREEITACIRKMAEHHVRPEQVDERMLETFLTFQYTPDIVVKSGGDHLTDFLIWQSVYSELFFTDVNWKYVRKVDFLRILRDYQSRVRRFGT